MPCTSFLGLHGIQKVQPGLTRTLTGANLWLRGRRQTVSTAAQNVGGHSWEGKQAGLPRAGVQLECISSFSGAAFEAGFLLCNGFQELAREKGKVESPNFKSLNWREAASSDTNESLDAKTTVLAVGQDNVSMEDLQCPRYLLASRGHLALIADCSGCQGPRVLPHLTLGLPY